MSRRELVSVWDEWVAEQSWCRPVLDERAVVPVTHDEDGEPVRDDEGEAVA